MVRNSCLVLLILSVFPAAAQETNCATPPTRELQCNDEPTVRRAPVGSLIWSDTNLFQRQADGSFRVRRTPLFRPFLDRGLH
jgi:hypothetical protein